MIMAKNSGNDNFNGSIGDKTYYRLKGVGPVVRKKSSPSKEDFLNNPKFEKTRQNNKEFGGASVVAKAIRMGLGAAAKNFQDSTLSGRLSGLLRKIIAENQGIKSQRPCNITTHKDKLHNFQLSKFVKFDNIYTAKPVFTSNEERTSFTMTLQNTAKYNHIKPPKTATYFKLTLALSIVSNHIYNSVLDKYEPVNPIQNAIGTSLETDLFEIKETNNNVVLHINTPNNQALTNDVTATLWLGITYSILEGKKFYDLPSQKVMKCITTF